MPDNTSPTIMWKTIAAAAVLCVLIVPLAMLGKGGKLISADEAETRIQPIARFELQKATATGATTDPLAVFNSVCAGCHATGAAGAPKRGDAAAWAPRLKQGMASMMKSARAGKGAMPPSGGAPQLSDSELKAVIELLVR